MRPIQFNETALTCQNPTLSSTGKGWNVYTHFNWFDKTNDISKLKERDKQKNAKLINLLKGYSENELFIKQLSTN
jgi:hypothetical protein